MADRNVRLITKRTSVPGKIPTGTTGSETNFIAQGELASNLVDKKLFSYDGSNVFEFGVNSFLGLTGGTITGNLGVTGNLSGSVLYSGSTNLYDIFVTAAGASNVTRVQPGSNISTGGTDNFPIINLVDSPFVNNITFSGTAIGGTVQAGAGTFTTLSGTNISATTFYGSGANLTGISGSFGITVDGSGSVITTGNKGYAIMPYNATITGWDIISNTSGTCVVDIWKNTSIPTSANTITGSEMPTLLNQQINSNNTINSWNKNISINDIISFNVLTASTVSRINLIIKVIKI